MGTTAGGARQYRQADGELKKALELAPGHPEALEFLEMIAAYDARGGPR